MPASTSPVAADKGPDASARDASDQGPAYAARVNNVVIPRASLERRLEQLERLYRHSRRPFDTQVRMQKREHLLGRLVDHELLRQHAIAQGVALSGEELEREHQRRVTALFGSPEALERFLRDQGLSAEEFRQQIEGELLVGLALDSARMREAVSEAEVEEVFRRLAGRQQAPQRLEASVIVYRIPPGTSPAGVERLERAAARSLEDVRTAAAFASAARASSHGPTAEKGGYLGWILRGTLGPAIEQALFAMPMKAVAGPLRSEHGIEFYWLHDRREAGTRALDEVREAMRERALREKLELRRATLVEELRKSAHIEYAADLTTSASRPAPYPAKTP